MHYCACYMYLYSNSLYSYHLFYIVQFITNQVLLLILRDMSPERIRGKEYSFNNGIQILSCLFLPILFTNTSWWKINIWSLGVILVEAALGRYPYFPEDKEVTGIFLLSPISSFLYSIIIMQCSFLHVAIDVYCQRSTSNIATRYSLVLLGLNYDDIYKFHFILTNIYPSGLTSRLML